MGRLILILLFCAILAVAVFLVASFVTTLFSNNRRVFSGNISDAKDAEMASSGIQKAAYIALIVVLFGVASGWLGGL